MPTDDRIAFHALSCENLEPAERCSDRTWLKETIDYVMIDDERELRILALVSMQAALLGVPTPSLRAVSVGWKDNHIRAEFSYDVPIDPDILDIVSVAEAEVTADLYEGMSASFQAKHLPSTEIRQLPDDHTWVFLRRES